MTALLKIINDKEKKFTEKIKELQEYLNDNKEIVINKELFILALLNIYPRNGDVINNEVEKIVYPILHHCIAHDSAISEEKKGVIVSRSDGYLK
ncbi:hypothetical protein [Wolbachia endosymbiont of Frankliniella intonsa]|uniref:hypothetical protein n=1 Tax=Wolbachia endosymbiont of Frankliniella intonsa TaxID=2902422 RepID=UPI00244E9C5B|nr:hypothetical protein [Wolbachia endosymbiont of Frankliniella intonsa]WGJ62355.1 hypothetical protein M3L71_01405 [Wolbachia endosymbiont of Frankliniella intonsa]